MIYAAAFSVFLRVMGLTSSINQYTCDHGRNTFEGNTKFEEFSDDFGEIFEEFILILGVDIDPFLEDAVFDEGVVGGKHHETLGLGIFILRGTHPLDDFAFGGFIILLPDPFLAEEELEIIIRQHSGRESPGLFHQHYLYKINTPLNPDRSVWHRPRA